MVLLKQILRSGFHYRPSSCGLGHIRCLANNSGLQTNYFITTPIFYVNSVPHIGHVYTVVLADASSRWQRLHGKTVTFTTGTDEHGLKIQQAASKDNKEPLTFCNGVSSKFQDVFKLANISYTDFVRTTEERHKLAVTEFWKTLESKDHIYKGKYKGWYSTVDEAFLTENQVIDSADEKGNKIKVSLESGHPVEWMEEENYLFRLNNFKDDLRNWIKTGVIKPAKFADIALSMINDDLPDLSISRQRDRLQWGIPVPNDDSQTIYVWLDALVNYLTAAGYPGNMNYWPPDCQVIGKDIIRFHAIYWPAFLMAAGLELPKTLFVHSHWTVGNIKMSKSRGNVVDPVQKLQDFGSDEVKYVLLREGVPHSDCNYSDYKIAEWVVCDLANAFGNLLNRCTAQKLNPYQLNPVFKKNVFEKMATKDDKKLLDQLNALAGEVSSHFAEYNIYKAIAAITEQLRETHGFFQRHEPWQMKFNKIDYLNCVLSVTMENLRTCGILMQPMMPSLAEKLLDRLAVPMNKRNYVDATEMFPTSEDVKLGPNPGPLISPKSFSHTVFAEERQKQKPDTK